jgi:6-phosphofructokinase 1
MKLAVLTSGGDAPGMNACVRMFTKCAIARGHTVMGVRRGYEGLLDGDLTPLTLPAVDGISRHGGTMLGSARSKRFPTEAGLQEAAARLADHGVNGLFVIGGNGSLTGAHVLGALTSCAIVGAPASIDNDVGHSKLAIGVDTAVNTIVEACDRISDTARAHRRAFVVEVMGRHCGYLAMRAGIAADADAILFAELGLSNAEILANLTAMLLASFDPARGKQRVLIIKAEGVPYPTGELVADLQKVLDEHHPGVDIRETILGHVVRGGNPSAIDRLIAQRLGGAAVFALEAGITDVMLGWEAPDSVGIATRDPSVRAIPLAEMLAETQRMLDGTSPAMQARVALVLQAQALLAL